ncbi:MAG: hypothetical protein H6735_21400 [Alphaproteobacteria bacterium]|nr:hypothetical protein [Alphaproteobacteria bacterium]
MLTLAALQGCIFITGEDVDRRDALLHPVVSPGALTVQVLDGPSGAPVPGATVTLDGAAAGVTDAAGLLRTSEVPAGMHVVAASITGAPPTGGNVEVAAGLNHPMVLELARTASGVVHRPSTGGAIARDGEYALVFDGGAFTGAGESPVTVSYAWVPPGARGAPAPLAAEGGGSAPIDLVAVAWVGDGARSDATYPIEGGGTIRIPAPTGSPLRGLVDASVYHFDETQGLWVATTSAELESSYLTGRTTGGGWWAIGQAAAALGCVSGDLGSAGAGALVRVLDPARPAAGTTWADDAGRFCAPVPPGHEGRAVALAMSLDGATWHWGEADAPAPSRVGTCGDACQEVDVPLTTLQDADGDSFVAGVGGDCDDADDSVGPGVVDVVGDGFDQDCDGVDGLDADHDGSDTTVDCDDADPLRAVGLPEVCDGRDNDCDSTIDRGVDHAVELINGGCAECSTQAMIDLGPKLYWSFREQGAVVSDASGYGNDGDAFGLEQAWSVNADDVAAPRLLGNISSGVRLPDFDEMGTDAVTVSVFMRPTISRRALVSYATPPDVATQDPRCNANTFLLQLVPGSLNLRMFDFSLNIPGGDAVDAWAHVVVSWRSDGTVLAYKNGSKIFEGELTAQNRTNICPHPSPPQTTGGGYPPVELTIKPGGALYLGQDQDCVDGCTDSEQSFDGAIDELMIFDRALDEREIETLYKGVTCGEGLTCDGEDKDGDSFLDEHLIGSDSVRCVAANCDEIVATESDYGDGAYWLVSGATSKKVACTFPDDGSDCGCRLCGDGVRVELYETCEDGDPQCDDCAIDSLSAPDCATIARFAPGPLLDGVYWIYPGGERLKARCDFSHDDGGWTLIVNQDTRGGTAFYDPQITEPPLSSASTLGVFDWRAANVADPYNGAYSILGHLDDLTGTTCYEFRMTWPFDAAAPLVWRQTSNPTAEATITGFSPLSGPPTPTVPFRGLRVGYGAGHPEPNVVGTAGANEYVTALMNADWDSYLTANWFGIGIYPLGTARNLTWKLYTSPDVADAGDGTARGSQLWGRPCSQ